MSHNEGCCDKCANMTGCGCCMSESEYTSNPLPEVVQNKQRQCTDIPCCLLLLACIVIEIIIIIQASEKGANASLLIHGYDYNGTICDDNNKNGEYTVWPSLSYYDIRLCSHSCSVTNDPNNSLMIDKYESSSFMDSYCIPIFNENTLNVINNDVVDTNFDDLSSNVQRGIADLYTTRWLILIMSFAAIIISFIYLKLVSCLSKILLIFTVIMVLCSGILFSWLLLQNGLNDYQNDATQHVGLIEIILSIIIIIITICFLLALWFSRKNIELIIEMLNEANHAIYDMKLTLIFPIWMSFLGIIYIFYWIVELMYIYSVKTESIQSMPDIFISINGGYSDSFKDLQFDYNAMRDILIWHCLILFYSVEVIIYFAFMVLAATFADWYFSEWMNKEQKYKKRGYEEGELSNSPISESLWRVTRYHLGSLAFGALIITIIRIIQGFVEYIAAKTDNAQNPVTKCIFCMVSCCLKCCECIFNRINKNGLIFTSIYGTSFCYSSFAALKLLFSNLGKTLIMTGISKYTETFGRIIISLLNTGIALLAMKYNPYYIYNLESYLFPSVIIFVISYIIAALFMMVFDVAIQTIFLCFLVDEAANGVAKFATEEMDQLMSGASSLTKTNNDKKGNVQTYAAV